MEQRTDLSHHHFRQLHGRRNDQNETDQAQIAQIKRQQQVDLDQVAAGSRQGEHKARGQSHAGR